MVEKKMKVLEGHIESDPETQNYHFMCGGCEMINTICLTRMWAAHGFAETYVCKHNNGVERMGPEKFTVKCNAKRNQ